MLTVLKFANIRRIIIESESDKWSIKFDTMDHLTSLPYAQYAEVSSPWELENGLAIFRGETDHFGMDNRPGRSTLAYANRAQGLQGFRANLPRAKPESLGNPAPIRDLGSQGLAGRRYRGQALRHRLVDHRSGLLHVRPGHLQAFQGRHKT
ncbi:MAG: hypothetical protein LBL95_00915 [Deltaproteobacteria bacterium]|nr:hypothetical protein [Deltaproteobacteria bacterium]